MRKRILQPTPAAPTPASAGWLDLEALARVEVSSEDPQHPIEAALTAQGGSGWRASHPGPLTLRLLFDRPQTLRRLRLRFCESEVARTQQFTLGSSPEPHGGGQGDRSPAVELQPGGRH